MKALLAALALTLAAGAAQAEPAVMRVRLAGLDLATEAGSQAALGRIRRAAVQFCGRSLSPPIELWVVQRQCRAEMVDKAVTQLDRPLVSARHRTRPAALRLAGR